jgi:hypothetical protein
MKIAVPYYSKRREFWSVGLCPARQVFEALAAGHRRQFINWFDCAKGTDTRIRRLGRAMDFLLARAVSRKTKPARAGRT